MRRIYLIVAFLLLGSLVFADDQIKIVTSLPRTGSANAQTTAIVNGVRLAIEQSGGIAAGFKIVHEDLDDASPERGQWDPALEAANADKAIADPDVMAYIGPYNSGASKISAPKLNAAGLLAVNAFSTWPGLTKPGKGEANEPAVYRPSSKVTWFRIVPADDIQGNVGAQWASELGLKSAYILHDRELYGKGVAEMFRKSSVSAGIEILGFDGYDPKASNYKSLATKIRQKQPAVIFIGATTQTNSGQVVKDLVSAGVSSKFMVPDGCFETAFIESAGRSNIEGRTYVTFGGVPAKELTGNGKVFYEEYLKKYKIEPEAYAVYGYEAAKVVLYAISQVKKKDRGALIEAVSKIRDFDGALGKWSLDENGDTTLRTMSGNTVENGQFKFNKLLGR